MKVARIAELSRAHFWFYQKLPPALGIAYAQLLITPMNPADGIVRCLGILISLIGCALYGYLINDWCDIAEDRRAGKQNLMETVPAYLRLLLTSMAVLLGFLPFLLGSFPKEAFFVVVADYLLSTLYSAFRWKERALRAIILDSAAAHFLPVLLVFAIFSSLGTPLSIIACIWAFLNGLRQILLHQLWDYKNDTRSELVTFVRRIGFSKTQSILRKFIYPAEIISFLLLASILVKAHWLFMIPVMIYPGMMLLKAVVWKRSNNPAPALATEYIPPNDFYESWLPLSLAALLVFQNTLFLFILAAHVVIFYKHIKRKEIENIRLLRDVVKLSFRHVGSHG